MSAYVPYQVDYRVENKAKSLGFSKKKVMFKFGIANNESIGQGMVGSNCRGSEHEITFIWSLKSGKRQILADNNEVHFSESGQNGWTADRTFQHHFGVVSPGFGTIRCHFVTLPSDPNAPGGNRPFDLRIGGISYFDFTKIFQLGTPAMLVRPVPRETGGYAGGGGGSRYPNPNDEAYATAEERDMIARAKLESLRDIRQTRSQEEAQNQYQQAPAPAPVPVSDSLISFDDPPPMPPRDISGITLDPSLGRNASQSSYGYEVPLQQQAPAPYSSYQIPPAQPFAAPAYGNYQLPPAPAPAYSNYQMPPAQDYSNYQLPPAPAPAPAYSNYQLPPAPAPSPAYSNYQLPPAPAPAYSSYQLPPAPASAPQYAEAASAYGQPPAYGQQPAPAAGYGYGQPAPYQQQAPPAVDPGMAFAQPPQAGATNPGFTSPQSAVSYGSAPSFAQPPRQYGY